MAVPVQTWGSMGALVAEQKEFGSKTADYLEANQVYDLFAHLLRQVVVHQPDNPVKFLQEQLRAKPALNVCIIGPPGINRSKYCQQVAMDYKLKHIHVGKLLRARKELREIIDSGALVDDRVVIDIMRAEVIKAQPGGWVLDGFPRTKIQAQALSLKEMGSCLDRVLLLHTGEKVIRQRYAAKVAAAGLGAAEREDVINMRLQQYQRHIVSIAELFKNIVRQIEVSAGDDDQNVTYNVIKKNLHVRTFTNTPLRSHRVVVVGPCASGRTTQCKALARNYGVVHVELAALLRKSQQARGLAVEDVPPEYVSDEELCALVGRRLNETDCLRKGWVLDGFPRTRAQAEFLRQSHLWPTRLLHLKVGEETSVQRAVTRRVDPVTALAYYRPPNNIAIRQRLVQTEHDQPEKVRARYASYASHVDKVVQTFPTVFANISAEVDIATLTRVLEDKIDTPMAAEVAQAIGGDEDA